MNRLALGISSITGGLSSALVPVLAVFLLPVGDYGAFALVFLVFAEGWSVQLSAVCDTWARRRAAGETAGTWGDYTGAVAAVSAVTALVTAAVGWWVYGSPLLGAAMAVGAGAALYRQGARYHHAIVRGPQSVVPSDVVAVLVLVVALVGLRASGSPMLTSLLLAWAASGLAASAFFIGGGALRGGGPVSWYRRNDRTVRVLLGESLLMDAGATGTPVLVAPILGLYQFGIYRSVSSLSVPLQLLIDPVRPNLSQIRPARLARPPVAGGLVAAAVVLGVAGYVVLTQVVPVLLSFSPVLVALSGFALPCSLFVALQFLTYVLNIFARMNVGHRKLLAGRAVHTVFAIALPVLGALLGSVTGAIWGFVASTGLTVVLWTTLLAGAAREGAVPRPPEQPFGAPTPE